MSTICSYRWGVAWSLASEESTWIAAADFAIDCGATASSLDVRGSMILEVADNQVREGQQQAFEEAIERGVISVIAQAEGYRGHQVLKGIESPERYLLLVYWKTIESHTVGFQQPPEFAEWCAIVGPFFASPPKVEHFDMLPGGFTPEVVM